MMTNGNTAVLLDTNVILVGALWPESHAARLAEIIHDHRFLTTDYVISELHRIIRDAAPDEQVALAALTLVQVYMLRLRVSILQDPLAGPGGRVSKTDAPIQAAAEFYGCALICTYNIKDFPGCAHPAVSPLGLLRRTKEAQRYLIQYPRLGAAGTLLVIGRQWGGDRLGVIVEDAVGTRIEQIADGRVVAVGPGVVTQRSFHRVPTGYEFAFVLRYRATGKFEAAAWSPKNNFPPSVPTGSGGKLLLTEGQLQLQPPITPRLIFGANYGLSGEVWSIGGIPCFVDDRKLRPVIVNECLEGIYGSKSSEELLRRCSLRELSIDHDIVTVAAELHPLSGP